MKSETIKNIKLDNNQLKKEFYSNWKEAGKNCLKFIFWLIITELL